MPSPPLPCVPAQLVIAGMVILSILAFIWASCYDTKRKAELEELHRTHILMYGFPAPHPHTRTHILQRTPPPPSHTHVHRTCGCQPGTPPLPLLRSCFGPPPLYPHTCTPRTLVIPCTLPFLLPACVGPVCAHAVGVSVRLLADVSHSRVSLSLYFGAGMGS
jgi:hypothetical protein